MFAWPRSALRPPPGRPMLPEQQLQHRGRVNQLHRVAVMRPAERVHDRAGAIRRVGRGDQLGHPGEILGRAAADVRDHLRRVARVEPLHHLEDRPRMLERRIDAREAALVELVLPARLVGVGLLLGIPAREHAGRLVERVPLVDEERRVREQPDVLVVIPVLRSARSGSGRRETRCRCRRESGRSDRRRPPSG